MIYFILERTIMQTTLAGKIWLAYFAVLGLGLYACTAHATGPTETFRPASNTSNSVSSAFSPSSADVSMYALPSVSLGAGSLSSGLCQSSWYRHRAYVFGIYASMDGEAKTDMECMGLLGRLSDLRAQPVPKAPVAILTQPECPVSPQKPVKTAQKVCK